MKKIVIATKNQGKLREMRQAFAHLPVEVVALDAFAEIPEPVEDGATFEENARIKAHAYALATHCACVADDAEATTDEAAEAADALALGLGNSSRPHPVSQIRDNTQTTANLPKETPEVVMACLLPPNF